MPSNNVLILKQLEEGYSCQGRALSGIVRVEQSFGTTELSLSLINISALIGGTFYLYIFGESGEVYTFTLSQRPSNFHKALESLRGIENGFGSALVAVVSDIPVTVAFGKTENFNLSLSSAKKLIAEKCLSDRRSAQRKNEILNEYKQSEPQIQQVEQAQNNSFPPEYNDEAVATVNYYELDQEINQKIKILNQIDNQEILEKAGAHDNESLSNEDGNSTDFSQKEEKEEPSGADLFQNETDAFSCAEQDERPFYVTAERELNTLFSKFPPYDNLKGFFPDSKWVKINYDNDKYYIVGLIKEDKKEKYICYGVPGSYSPEPPKELKGYCSFIPLSIFDTQGDGFWMLFQDAVSGECITPK